MKKENKSKQVDLFKSRSDLKTKALTKKCEATIHLSFFSLCRWCRRRWTRPGRAGHASSWPTACPPSKTPTGSLSCRVELWSNRGHINSCWPRRESTTCWSPHKWATEGNERKGRGHREQYYNDCFGSLRLQRAGLNICALYHQLLASNFYSSTNSDWAIAVEQLRSGCTDLLLACLKMSPFGLQSLSCSSLGHVVWLCQDKSPFSQKPESKCTTVHLLSLL